MYFNIPEWWTLFFLEVVLVILYFATLAIVYFTVTFSDKFLLLGR